MNKTKFKNRKNESESATKQNKKLNRHDKKFGVSGIKPNKTIEAWLFNVELTSVFDENRKIEQSGVKLYFVDHLGQTLKTILTADPYIYIRFTNSDLDIESSLKSKFTDMIKSIELVKKVDLDQKNHLSGIKENYYKVSFPNERCLSIVKKRILGVLKKNEKISQCNKFNLEDNINDVFSAIADCREHDVPFIERVLIDWHLRVGNWYEVTTGQKGLAAIKSAGESLDRPPLCVCAFDIETTKAPFKFPDAAVDSVMMISLMINQQGYLIVNREIVSEDIEDFEYTPKPRLKGRFKIFNEQNEVCLLQRFFVLLQENLPNVYVTYNGDFFDWPFLDKRCGLLGFDMEEEIGVFADRSEYRGRFCLHLDAFCWVKRDSYLPVGSQGLKAVTREKMGYEPDELDPEKMVQCASDDPRKLATYSVSDAVATFYLYMEHIHAFVFSLCAIIPLPAHEVLRKGTGGLCEALLMAEAFEKDIIAPNKQFAREEAFYGNRLLESETYVGGHVECIEAGVFREDIPIRFALDPKAIAALRAKVADIVRFAIETEGSLGLEEVSNYAEVVKEIDEKLAILESKKTVLANPLIYHFDVISMYPNIILSNRLQPASIVTNADCAACDFNQPENRCKRYMPWTWRGKCYPVSKGEYFQIKAQLHVEQVATPKISADTQSALLARRVRDYSRKVYKRLADTFEEPREAVVCQRENPFYVDVVRSFRDRRYTLKAQAKRCRQTARAGQAEDSPKLLERAIVFDSMQLAHKCLLNSFYGYVMRRSSRWYSMPMAAVTTKAGAEIIKRARELLEGFARPLELDTDGVWCCLPGGFPAEFELRGPEGKDSRRFSFLCSALNVATRERFGNDSYQTLADESTRRYEVHEECSIFFEADGPYRCMMLPASPEEGKTLKKRYAVFARDGSLVELKGFELKRRGELKIVKIFQKEVFPRFLQGTSLEEVYESVAETANYWLNIIFRKGEDLRDEEVFDLFAESKNMSKKVSEYENKNSTSITCALRLAEFLGKEALEGSNLSLKFIVSRFPANLSVSKRVVPAVIFQAEESAKQTFLRRWCAQPSMRCFDVRDIIDWEYYKARLGVCIRKIVTLPAALQNIKNPVQRLPHPDWLLKRLATKIDPFSQTAIDSFFRAEDKTPFSANNQTTADLDVSTQNSENSQKIKPKPKRVHRLDDNFSKWSKAVKRKWSKLAKMAKKSKNGQTPKFSLPLGGMASYLDFENASFLKSVWSVLKVQRSAQSPGEFVFWVSPRNSGHLARIRVGCPRKVLLNRFSPAAVSPLDERLARFPLGAARKALPRNHRKAFLYQISMSEELYISSFTLFAAEKADFGTKGVYESFVPPLFKSIALSTSLVKLRSEARSKAAQGERQLLLEDLAPVAPGSAGGVYLEKRDFDVVFVYHSRLNNRGVFAMFESLAEKEAVKVNLIVVNKTKMTEFEDLQAEKLFEKHCKNKKAVVYKHTAPDFSRGMATLRSLVTALKRSKSCLVVQSILSTEELLPGAKEDFPVFSIAFHVGDESLPAFRWVHFLAATAMKRFAVCLKWWAHSLGLARYTKIPMGNLSLENIGLVTDILFARLLMQNGVALWVSKGESPDLGGFEEDELGFGGEFCDSEGLERASFVNSGVFRSFCVEINIPIFAVCAVLESDAIDSLEVDKHLARKLHVSGKDHPDKVAINPKDSNLSDKHEVGTYFRGINGISRETSSCFKGFKAIKQLLSGLFRDAFEKGDRYADLILGNFYSWLRSEKSLLYEPSLYKYVNFMMKKYLHLLINEFRKIGSKVVFASFDRLIISTDKFDAKSAATYISFLLDTIRSREIFSLVEMTPGRVWSTLVFLNKDNFAGVECTNERDNAEDKEKTEITSHWTICEFLPAKAEKCFQITLSRFILDPLSERAKLTHLPSSTLHSKMHQFTTDLIHTKITRSLLNVISVLVKSLSNTLPASPEIAFRRKKPLLEATKSSAVDSAYNPTLNMVSYLCKVLSLDEAVESEVMALKSSLLKILGVPSFAPEAQFIDPCRSLVLEDIACDYCSRCCDIDLCRDAEALTKKWVCSVCTHRYNLGEIERRLVTKFHRLLLGYHSQDLYCPRCRTSRVLAMRSMCACTSKFEQKFGIDRLRENLSLYEDVAQYYGFGHLEGFVKQSQLFL